MRRVIACDGGPMARATGAARPPPDISLSAHTGESGWYGPSAAGHTELWAHPQASRPIEEKISLPRSAFAAAAARHGQKTHASGKKGQRGRQRNGGRLIEGEVRISEACPG